MLFRACVRLPRPRPSVDLEETNVRRVGGSLSASAVNRSEGLPCARLGLNGMSRPWMTSWSAPSAMAG